MDVNIPEGSPADMFITEALDARAEMLSDAKGEGRAILDLVLRMANDPQGVLPQFVDMALVVTGASTGGLSLYEPAPELGVFRWCCLRGRLEPFNGASTPRNYSPCGITLDSRSAVLVSRPERSYDWLVEAGVGLPEVLLVPLFVEGSEPAGTLWIVSEEEGRFTRNHARLLEELAGYIGEALYLRDFAAAQDGKAANSRGKAVFHL